MKAYENQSNLLPSWFGPFLFAFSKSCKGPGPMQTLEKFVRIVWACTPNQRTHGATLKKVLSAQGKTKQLGWN